MTPSIYRALIERTKKHEGFRATPYLDSVGVGTIGYGTTHITEQDAAYLLERYMTECVALVEGYLINEGISLDDFRISILAEMAYQLGFKGLLGFRKMFKALKSWDYVEAARQMRDSKWYRQTPARCADLAIKMECGG